MSFSSESIVSPNELDLLISTRRTSKPSEFDGRSPDREIVRACVDVARKAPNHHRTEPARFYLLDDRQIGEVAKINAERVTGDSPTTDTLERATRKQKEWGESPGLLVVTCHTDLDSDLVRTKPTVVREDYAAVCCMTQNLLLLLHNLGIATKWSTAPIEDHPRFAEIVGLKFGKPNEYVVALVFHGYTSVPANERSFLELGDILVDGAANE
ncbi:MAG: nitroreductase family protein [Opitutales bacterium]